MGTPSKTATVKAKNGRSSFLDEGAWINAALDILVSSSVDAVGVEPLAKQLGVTKGSFYWHFKDRPALLRAILRAWRQRATLAIIERLEQSHATPEERLRQLLELPTSSPRARQAAQVELAIRAWARRDELAAAAVQEVDKHRLSYIVSLLRSMGFKNEEADVRAVMIYVWQFAESLIATGETEEKKARRRALSIEELLTK